MTFLNKFQVFLKSLKGHQEVLVTSSQEFVLIDKGIDFVLDRFKGGRFTIMGRMRGVGDYCLDRSRGIILHPGVLRRGGGFRAAAIEWGHKGIYTFPPSAPLSIRHQTVGWKESADRADKVTNKRG